MITLNILQIYDEIVILAFLNTIFFLFYQLIQGLFSLDDQRGFVDGMGLGYVGWDGMVIIVRR